MSISKHDKVGKGFQVNPEQLAHDLALLKLAKTNKLSSQSSEHEYYDQYIETLHEFTVIIEDKTRYDSSFKE
ncbi:MAG: hypothetical protein H6Q71_1478 [Firmicutes bacterium]|nr:hypothetical protein [Bacillota bacterium]